MENRMNKEGMKDKMGMSYKMFLLMLLISFVIMYGVMFLNVDKPAIFI